ncbi:hypothetical protein ACH5RR_018093 [Cinchona calisaya]|uniref:Uncharacterized protein n=1 Tax=Cinchona calisaya TaxID=153742 RepID=A0ABD2ZKF5_9GENT
MGLPIRLLRVCDIDEKPSMGYVYEEFRVVEEEPNSESNYEELEAELEELLVDDVVECSIPQKAGDDEDDDKIREDVDLVLFQHRDFGRIDKDDEWLN